MELLAKSAGSNGAQETLFAHSSLVVEFIRLLSEQLPGPAAHSANLPDLELIAAVHDVGKSATGFQDMLSGKAPNWHGRRHEVLSAAFAAAMGASREATLAVLTHHRRLPSLHSSDDFRLRFHMGIPEDWEALLSEFQQNRTAFESLWVELCSSIGRPDLAQLSKVELTSRILPGPWLKVQEQPRSVSFEERKCAAFLRGLLISADHLASAHRRPPPPVALTEFSPKMTLRPFQQKAAIQGNVILRAPTGSGKTEAALVWAAANQVPNGRLFYTLPFTAALNAMHLRLQSVFHGRADAVGILHGKAAHHLYNSLQEDYPGQPARAAAEAHGRVQLAREMYHPIRVCTPHQLLRYTLRGKGWEQLFTEFPGACVVFDEVHSYDPKFCGLALGTARLLNELGARVMFVSATLPGFLQNLILQSLPCTVLAPDPDQERDREILDRKRHRVVVADSSLADLIPNIIADISRDKTVLVVCNHVRSAQSMARELRQKLDPPDVMLFHSRFNMRDRSRIERSLKTGTLPRVLVATQVVEVSMDISFDAGYFEAAPIDALAQRMGRVNRAGLLEPALITIATHPLNSHQLYDSFATQATLEKLRQCLGPISEADIVEICDDVYKDGFQGDDWRDFDERRNHPCFTKMHTSMVAGDHEDWTDTVIEVANTVDLLPVSLKQEYGQLRDQKRWLDADALTVSVRVNKRLLEEHIDKSHDPWVVNLPYGADGLELP